MSNDPTREKSWFEERMEDPSFQVSFAQEWASLGFCEQIDDALEVQKMKRSDLATKLGRSRSWVTQALRKGRNLTISTMAELAHALGLEIEIVLRPRRREVDTSAPQASVVAQDLLMVNAEPSPCGVWATWVRVADQKVASEPYWLETPPVVGASLASPWAAGKAGRPIVALSS